MKLTTGILAVVMMTGAAWAQNPAAAANTSTAKSPQQQAAKPAPGAPASAVKPAAIPGAKPAAVPAKAAVTPAPVRASQNNTLQRVNVIRNADDVQIEISSREAVTPKVDKLSSPARVVVTLPATVMATEQSKIPVGSAGVKGVRIGMDGKTPPTTSVVVDLEQALAYELKPGPGNTVVLTLHTKAADKAVDKAVAKSTPAPVPAKASTPAPKLQIVATKPAPAAPVVVAQAKSAPAPAIAVVKPHDVFVPQKPAPAPVAVAKATTPKPAPAAAITVAKVEAPKPAPAAPVTAAKAVASKPAAVTIPAAKPVVAAAPTKIAADEKPAVAQAVEAPKPPKPEEKKWAMNGKRDPFFSPVVQQPTGSGCSTGKKCLEIGQINLRGVVKSEGGFIAVVTNSLNKAYFLHENDPVFNGYVVRITGDSVVFQETVPDKLGKPFTREVVKRITTPAV
jgi:Tfp pilus assembly protein PilP